MTSQLSRGDWILLALSEAPLDRIRLMKTLFLFWYQSGKNIPDYFDFIPYLYGPYSTEVYRELNELIDKGLISQPPDTDQSTAKYYLTVKGRETTVNLIRVFIEPSALQLLREIVAFTSRASFDELLNRVYSIAPEYAVRSVARST